jgi:hypothetical protein
MNKDKLITRKGKLFDQTGLQLDQNVVVTRTENGIWIGMAYFSKEDSSEYVLTKNKLTSLPGGWYVIWD